MNLKRSWLYMIAALVVVPSGLHAQPDRYDLGQRLKAFETTWEQARPDEAARKRALEPLKRSVSAFLIGRQSGISGRALDEARFALLSAAEPDAAMRWAAGLSVRPKSRALDTNVRELPLELVEFYPPRCDPPADAILRLSLFLNGKSLGNSVEARIGTLPQAVSFPFADSTEGDYEMRAEIVVGSRVLAISRQIVSRVADTIKRRNKLAADLEVRGDVKTTDVQTLKSTCALLDSLLGKPTLETDYPAARLLAEAEALARAIAKNDESYFKNKIGQSWLTIAVGDRTAPVRLFAPEAVAKGKPVPLVIALHGAGGSENLFFEGYGNGAIVKQCRERGWLLAAPRSEGFGFGGRFGRRPVALTDVIDELARLYPVDRERVFLVGHSMGAGQAIYAVTQAPDRFRGVAALGGGNTMRRPETVNKMPFFVGCGSEDFALSGAQGLARSLQKIEGAKVVSKEYADIEHLMIVQVALPDVFAFFDELARSK